MDEEWSKSADIAPPLRNCTEIADFAGGETPTAQRPAVWLIAIWS